MKIPSIQYDTALRQGYHSGPDIEGYSAGLNNNTGYNVAFSGSGASKIEKAAAKSFDKLGETVGDKIFKSEKYKKVLEIFEEKTVVAQALVALAVAGVLRPATNMAMADKHDREDSMYAASHAIASAVIGFIVSSIAMAPFDKAFRKIKKEPSKYLDGLADRFGVKKIGPRQLEKSRPYKNISKFVQMVPDTFLFGVPKAMITIALIPAILKYVFGWEKKPKDAQNGIQTDTIAFDRKYIKNSSAFEKLIGGAE